MHSQDLTEYLKQRVIEFLENKIRESQNKKSLIRDEELNVFEFTKDYESEILKAMHNKDIIKAKVLYSELLNKFEAQPKLANNPKALNILNSVTRIIKNNLKEYNEELLLKESFDRYEKILSIHRAIPKEIAGVNAKISFFNEEEAAKLKLNTETNNKNIINLTVNPLIKETGTGVANTFNNAINNQDNTFPKAKIKYDESNPTHIIELFAKYFNGYLILVKDLATNTKQIFFINEKPLKDKIIILN